MQIDYFVIYLYLFFISLISCNKNLKIFNLLYVLTWIFLAFFSGTRLCVGQDWIGYGNFYSDVNHLGLEIFNSSDQTEILYKLIALILTKIALSFESFNLLISIFICILLSISFAKISKKYKFLLTLLYYSTLYFSHQFGIVRTGFAAAIFLYSYLLIFSSNYKFLVLGIITANLHRTSVVSFVLLYLSKVLSRSTILYISILLIIINLINDEIIINILKFLLITFEHNYVQYLDQEERYFKKISIIKLTYLTTIFYIFTKIINIKINNIIENFVIVFITINIILNYSFIGRFNAYGSLIIICYFILILDKTNGKIKFLPLIIIYIYSIFGISNIFSSDLIIFHNYKSWIFNIKKTFSECDTSLHFINN